VTNLASRVLVVVVLAPVVLGAIYLGGWWLVAVALVAVVLGLDELYRMARPHRPLVLAGQAGGIAAVIGAHAGGPRWALAAIAATLVLAFVLAAGVAMRESATAAIAVTMLGPVWIGLGVAFLVLLRDLGPGRTGFNVLLAVVLGTWASDIFAYFGGRALGRHKLAPAISPKKTVEGFVIGLVCGVVVVWWTLYGERSISHTDAAIVGVAVCVFAPFGDLFESFLKRDLGVKDSGRLLAGHGGMLDRIDALLFAGPAAWIVLELLLA
jgi:phosphatidate cytidylyltransferase